MESVWLVYSRKRLLIKNVIIETLNKKINITCLIIF